MKIILAVIFLLCTAVISFAADTNFVGVDLMSFSKKKYGVSYEREIPGFKARDFEIATLFYKDNVNVTKKWETVNIEFHIAFNKYSNNAISQGYFWGPRLGLRYTRAKMTVGSYDWRTGDTDEGTARGSKVFFIPEVRLGYKWTIPYGIGLGMNAGFGVVAGDRLDLSVNNSSDTYGDLGPFLRIGINLGYTW